MDIGRPLGHFIRDGFFHPWTDPHIHIELRSRSHPIRATGGYPLEPKITNTCYVDGELDEKEAYSGRVVRLDERYALVELQAPFTSLETFFGICGLVGDEAGWLMVAYHTTSGQVYCVREESGGLLRLSFSAHQ